MCDSERCANQAIEIERLTHELQNCTENKAWLECQNPKLEKQLRALKVSAAEKEHSALNHRRKFIELEKRIKAEQHVSQHQMRKLTNIIKDKDRKIEELNATLRKSPRRKAPLDNEPITKPMFTRIYENGILSFDLPKCQELQSRAELKVVNAVLKEQIIENQRVETLFIKLSRVFDGLLPVTTAASGDAMSQLEAIVEAISSNHSDFVSSDKHGNLESEIISLDKRCQLLESLLQASESRVEDLLNRECVPQSECLKTPINLE